MSCRKYEISRKGVVENMTIVNYSWLQLIPQTLQLAQFYVKIRAQGTTDSLQVQKINTSRIKLPNSQEGALSNRPSTKNLPQAKLSRRQMHWVETLYLYDFSIKYNWKGQMS
ncbi:hypothetical protein C2G38_2154599 [Gigaspora rosea]|uniref:Uncharacterized protein n=1 Tax=Gigaspora rosea TaxID=44941 RepID=A0A397W8M3_9GLOM|nr:hypothetical protein C2G38_2154599 [Gigaspora rosea]